MADTDSNISISKTDSGFPPYLDFDKLRSSAITYLGNLSGNIWTDHNVHDPGITILEMLIYALMDLGYRSNMPVEDLLARNPEDKSKDTNFFTPSQILANNPLTITDYRKMLVDIKHVKNAWLVIEDQWPVDLCGATPNDGVNFRNNPNQIDPCRCDHLNGLYHVYIQLEDDNLTTEELNKLKLKIRRKLMAHRNLCEDFIDITILCTLDLGVCAQIDLDPTADVQEVLFSIVESLSRFFSPSPVFYSLQELLDKQKPIEEIFSGRPFNITESHGFIDTEEFEHLTLRKELHLSDVYSELAGVDGISRVQNLKWITCCDNEKTSSNDWQLALPTNYVPSFSLKCSSFSFTQNGKPVPVDFEAIETYESLKFSSNRKALYKEPSTFLDPEYTKGIYRNDLGDYYSIQNEFPRVYGIGEGMLGKDVSIKRRAQALQLQGFLLFFDQFLANYLAQLKNIRSLFSFSSIDTTPRTYFTNKLANVPQLQQLLRFRADEGDNNIGGTRGGIIGYPTSRKNIEKLIANNGLGNTNLDRICNEIGKKDFPPYAFCFATERDQALSQLQEDFLYGDFTPVIVSNYNDCYFFYFFTSSPDIAIISQRYYKNETDAAGAAASMKYAASLKKNFRSFGLPCCEREEETYSFDIEFNLDLYADYLQLIVEDADLFSSRRQQFLNHLLSRFAETFSDFALLSSPFFSSKDLQTNQIHAQELFLQRYPDISSNRGKGYDYLANKWGNYNISGFEKRFKALAGIDDWRRHYLCNFIVEPATKLYRLAIHLFDHTFTVENKTVTATEGLASLKAIYSQLKDPLIEYGQDKMSGLWKVFISDGNENNYTCSKTLNTETDARTFKNQLDAVLKFRLSLPADIRETRFAFNIVFADHQGNPLAVKKKPYHKKEEADKFVKDFSAKPSVLINELKEINPLFESIKKGKLILYADEPSMLQFINEKAFSYQPIKEVQLKDNKKRFVLLDEQKTFQFNSVLIFNDSKQAKASFIHLVTLLTNKSNYDLKPINSSDSYELFITDKGKTVAKYMNPFNTQEEGKDKLIEIFNKVSTSTYKLYVANPVADEYEFTYSEENLSGDKISYVSNNRYEKYTVALAAANTFYDHIADLKTETINNRQLLVLDIPGTHIECVAELNPDAKQATIAGQLLTFKQQLFNTISNPTEAKLQLLLESNNTNPGEDFIYKLVDKDGMPAYYTGFKTLTDIAQASTERHVLINRANTGYNFAEIITGGIEIVHIRKEKNSETKWYHYRLVCNNRKYKQGPLKGKNLILFESVLGYLSQDDATKAFSKNYLLILKYASDINEYGDQKNISLEEKIVHEKDCCNQGNSIVFVPKKTSDEYGGYEVPKELAPLAASYPIKYSKKRKYGFVLGQIDDTAKTYTVDWRSRFRYATAIEAMQAFRYTLLLLKYPDNFYVEWDRKENCYQIFIREVVAESAHGYESAEDAWGKDGVEQFICVAQSQNGFHAYQSALTCDYGFFVSCGNTGLIHPCQYETRQRRDNALKSLYNAGSFNFLDLLSNYDNGGGLALHDNDPERTRVAIIRINKKANVNRSFCEALISLAASVNVDEYYARAEGTFQLNCRTEIDGKLIVDFIVKPIESTIKLEEWKTKLKRLVRLIPVVYRQDACNDAGKKKYFIEIKYPGLNDRAEEVHKWPSAGNPCDEGCFDHCPVAWKSECCFDECCDALAFYLSSLDLLSDINNYRPVYECHCGSYSIALHARMSLEEQKKWKARPLGLPEKYSWICNDRQQGIVVRGEEYHCENQIIAICPQHYTNDSMACDAISKAKRLINSEGLHLTEHILLRPRCEGDCSCENYPVAQESDIHCHFPWEPGGEKDACEADKHVCFTPGCDPYSFIATVALPAWPERFRLKENRAILEKMLQREAPAHVMLRILWLNPRDFCCFENYFVLWTELMAQKINRKKYNACDFLGFLFKRHYGPFEDCTDCIPCNCKDNKEQPCQETDTACNATVLDKINELFGWDKGASSAFNKCEQSSGPPLSRRSLKKKSPRNNPDALQIATKVVPDTVPLSMDIITNDNDSLGRTISKKDSDPVNVRRINYIENIVALQAGSESTLAEMAKSFINNPKPAARQFEKLTTELATDKIRDKKENILSKDQRAGLIENITWRYLDLACVADKDPESIISIRHIFSFLRGHGFDMKRLYKRWDVAPIKKLNPSIKFKKIQEAIIGK